MNDARYASYCMCNMHSNAYPTTGNKNSMVTITNQKPIKMRNRNKSQSEEEE